MKTSLTLAETLITIAIIGIVISMTLPAVILNYQKKTTLVKLKKAYTILQQVLERSSYEYGGNMSSFVTTGNKVTQETTKAFINTFWLPYFDSPYVSPEGTFPYGKSVPYSGFNNTVYNTSVTTSYKDGRFFFHNQRRPQLLYFYTDLGTRKRRTRKYHKFNNDLCI